MPAGDQSTMENKENLPPVEVAAKDVVAPPKVALAPTAVADANVNAPTVTEKEITSSVTQTKVAPAVDVKSKQDGDATEAKPVVEKEITPACDSTPTVGVEDTLEEEAQAKKDEEKPKEEGGEIVESVDITNASVAAPVSAAEKAKLKPLSPTAEPFVMSGAFTTPRKSPPPLMGHGAIEDTPTSISGSLPPMTPQRGSGLRTPRSARSAQTTPVSPNVELTAKQVRELRRLCRKTANRAEYEGRLVQLRQIASILAMGGPSLVHFAPSYLSAHSAMQAWLDSCRAEGADWRDERPLTLSAVEELREWDRLLKAWAKRRFPTLADCSDGSAPPTTPRSKRLDIMSVGSPMSAPGTPSPARNLVASQTLASPTSCPSGSGRRRVSRMSISTDGDTINVSIVRTPDKAELAGSAAGKSPWRVTGSPRSGNVSNQENVNPEGDQSPRDWGSLRKASPSRADKPSVPVVPLKARNW